MKTMERIFSMDDAAPDAIGAKRWLEEHLGVKNLDREVLYNIPVKFDIGISNESDEIFQHKGVFYMISFGCDANFQAVYTLSPEEAADLINKRRDLLIKGEQPEPVDGRAVRTFEVIYFKDTGKRYTEGSFDLEVKLLEGGEPYMETAYEHVHQRQQTGTLPGLGAGCGKDFTILVSYPGGSCRLLPALR